MSDDGHADAAAPTEAPPAPTVDHEATIRDLQSSLTAAQAQLSAQATKLSAMSDLETELAQLKDQHSFLKAAKEAVEAQLQAERVKRETAEEASEDKQSQIETLRGQVEAARRGVGILQKQEKERKRMSTIGGLGLSGSGVDALVEEAGEVTPEPPAPKSAVGAVTDKVSKRASMILGTVKPAHKRSSSISDGSDQPSTITGNALSTSPNPQPSARPGLRELRLGATSSTPPSMYSPSIAEGEDHSRMPPYRSVSSGTVGTIGTSPTKRDAALREAINKERELREVAEATAREAEEEHAKLAKEVSALHRQLEESEEARLASDACLQALRDFISNGAGGPGEDPTGGDPAGASQLFKGISLPPLPTDRDADLRDDKPLPSRPTASPRKPSAGAWGFTSLFRNPGPASPAISTTAEPPATPQPLLSPPPVARNTSSTRSSPLPAPQELDERSVEGIPAATPVTWVSSWTKNVPSSSSTLTTPVAPGPAAGSGFGPGGEPLSPPLPPSSTRKLSSFFGFNRETKLPVSHEFDAHDAFTPEPPQGDHLEPSPMPNDDVVEEKPTPGTSHSALTDEVTTPALLSPRSQAQSVVSEDPKRHRETEEGAERAAVQA